jgi:hypothetical protein
MMNLLIQTTKSRRSEDGVSHLEAGYESLGNDINILKVENVSLKVEIARQGDELDILKVENVGLKVEIIRQGNEITRHLESRKRRLESRNHSTGQ